MKCVKCGGEASVLETRPLHADVVTRRTRKCTVCDHKFATYEVDEGIWKSVRKVIPAHADAIEKKKIRFVRNQHIAALLRQGEKHSYIANKFGLCDSMISTIAAEMGIPSRRTGLLREWRANASKKRTRPSRAKKPIL
jgi:hypothetical protein